MFRIIIITIFFLSSITAVAQLYDLRCEHRITPVGVDKASPILSWKIKSDQRGFLQSAYQVVVAEQANELENDRAGIWNSGKQVSGNSIQVVYKGKALKPATTYYWKVRVWDQENKAMAWSVTSQFTTGLFAQADWKKAQWIGYEDIHDTMRIVPGVHGSGGKLGEKAKQRPVTPLFRKEFTIAKKVRSAVAFVSGLGQYEMSLNGRKTGESFLAPGWTFYDKTCLYNAYDVTDQLQPGRNVVGVVVGNGFHHINRERYRKLVTIFGMPKMICLLKITYTDGAVQTIVSDQSWKTAPSAITFNSIFGGEDYDAQLEQAGWNKSGFQDASWKNALPVTVPKGKLMAELDYPVKVMQSFTAKKVTQLVAGSYVYDFGQNISGIVVLKVRGKKGQTVKLIPAELINDQQLANQKATGSPYYFSYTLKGDGEETWRPVFSYYGFRYVQVEGAVPDTATGGADLPKITRLTSLHTRNSTPTNGSFVCSNSLFNRIDTLIQWGIKGNLQSVITDCPHREKLSWLEQDYLMGASVKYNFETYNLYNKLIHDMMDAQLPDGMVPDIAPEFVLFDGGFRDSPEWGSAAVILPWLQYKWYGDTAIIRKAYPMMEKYVSYLKSKSQHHILSHGLGDWYDLGPNRPGFAQLTPMGLTATAIYYYDVKLLSKMSSLLGKSQAATAYAAQAKEIRQVFNDTFFNVSTKVYATGSQTSMAMPLVVGLVEDKHREAVFKNLVDSITTTGKKLTAGDVGFHFLVQALQEGGASPLLYDMNFRDDVPGYGYQLKKGATALTESWQALEVVSNNHLMLGHIMEWFYGGLAGIRQSDRSVAWSNIVIQPEVVGDISYVKGSYESLYGTIVSEWKKEGNVFTLNVTIPANTRATVHIPGAKGRQVTEGGEAVQIIAYKDDYALVGVGAGKYEFVVK
ncbi:family 78 glycoside hydrolase catalytic domain [Pseudoflavitalea sp. X16]|uniref:family 78 glycoside hydrolase catalytic domain n=1 Tax=Paraflavitalea devenefica TaxID=2716334 RepID=UPI00141E977D|nr:family 78 glycoside hydrolase catalytic domain [Paraflavitalea devenefica]NII29226.1 family 78 glycoside hydrolase catalytic domain [Paraflavitalea devenefica]